MICRPHCQWQNLTPQETVINYNITKSKVVAVNARKEPTLTLNGTPLEWSQKEIHLRIHRTASGDNANTVSARINDAR